jgi:hypothetical protein
LKKKKNKDPKLHFFLMCLAFRQCS